MLYRHLVTKSFSRGLVSKALVTDNYAVYSKLTKEYGNNNSKEGKSLGVYPSRISSNIGTDSIKRALSGNKDLSSILVSKSHKFRTLKGVFSDSRSEGIIANSHSDLRLLASEMFGNTNPLTGGIDVYKTDKNAGYYALVTLTGTLPPQSDENGKVYFNPKGIVTVAEFLDSLSAVENGSNFKEGRRKSLDNVSYETDYFNKGYQSCLKRFSSPFYNLYTRAELLKPITRLELAYIFVICWEGFQKRFGGIRLGKYTLGYNIDWNNYNQYLADFEDGFDYQVSKVYKSSEDTDSNIISTNIKDYMQGSVSNLKEDILKGVSSIPFPMFMSMLEINHLGIFEFENMRLDPIREVSRGELAYFLVRLSSIFKDN